MSRYTSQRLAEMARTVREAAERGDDRAFRLYLTISAITGIAPNDVRDRIAAFEVPRET